jgi:hypothetical protein
MVSSGASLLHYDAKAHLLVARRVLDNQTPGWFQLGAVWLPLPHILNMLPALDDRLYASGAAASLLGYVFFMGGAAGLAWAARRATGDPWAGVVALAVPVFNPGWLYLQSTPLTEPLYLGPVGGLCFFLARWRETRGAADLRWAAACAAAACLVRYEAWPIVALSVPVALLAVPRAARNSVLRYAAWGLVAPILYFGVHSWISDGIPFYMMPARYLSVPPRPLGVAWELVWSGVRAAFGPPLTLGALAAFAVLAARRSPLGGLALAGLGPLSVTWVLYVSGHPTKARYALLLAPAAALALAGATARWRPAQAAVLALAALQAVSIARPAPAVAEATQWIGSAEERAPVANAFRHEYRGGRMLASMASSAPFLFELRIPVRELVFEGNKEQWRRTLGEARGEVAWVLVTEGDVVDRVHRQRPELLDGFSPWRRFRKSVVYVRDDGATPPNVADAVPSAATSPRTPPRPRALPRVPRARAPLRGAGRRRGRAPAPRSARDPAAGGVPPPARRRRAGVAPAPRANGPMPPPGRRPRSLLPPRGA